MTVDGFKTESELKAEKEHKTEQKETVATSCGERLKSIFRDASDKHEKDVQQVTDGLLATKEGGEEIERYKGEVLELVNLEAGHKGRSNPGERLRVYHQHEVRWQILERQFKAGELTPVRK